MSVVWFSNKAQTDEIILQGKLDITWTDEIKKKKTNKKQKKNSYTDNRHQTNRYDIGL